MLILTAIFFTNFTFSQNNEEDILNDPEFEVLSKKATEFYTSEDYINFEKIRKEFIEKVGKSFHPGGSLQTEKYQSWIIENLNKTNFTSLEEALAVHKKYYDAILKKPNDDLILNLTSKLENKYGAKKFNPVFSKHVLRNIFKVWKENNIYP